MDSSSVHLEKVINKLNREISTNKLIFLNFVDRFKNSPFNALTWADYVFCSAAETILFTKVLESISDRRKESVSDSIILVNLINHYLKELTTSILSNAGNSTSTCANLIKKAEHVALAKLYNYLTDEWFLLERK